MMNIGTNDRDHPISSPINTPSPRPSSHGGPDSRQESYELGYRANFSPSHSPLSPQCLERPFDERSHNRRPSDEATMILRKISSSGNCGVSPYNMFGNSLGVNLPENKTHSLPPGFMPMESSSYQDFMDIPRMTQHNTLGLGETGRMLSAAFSDSYLPSVGMSNDPLGSLPMGGGGLEDQRLLSPEDSLMPPLTGQMRHPSAPHLASILSASASLDRGGGPGDTLTAAEEEIPMRKRSWSMPANAHLRIMAPQISISSPDDPIAAMFLDRPPETIGESTIGGNTFSEQLGRNLEVSKCLQEAQLPADPTTWTEDHVRCWAEWTVKEFGLSSVDLQKFSRVNGQFLCFHYQFLEAAFIKEHGNKLSEFLERIKAVAPHRPAFHSSEQPLFPHEFDYSMATMISNNHHLTSPPHGHAPAITIQGTLSSAHNFIPTTSQAMSANGALLFPPPPPYRPNSPALSDRSTPYSSPVGSPMPSPGASPFYSPNASPCPSPSPPMRPHNPSGSGPIQLWQFLLELLTDRDCQNCIAWTGREWEFKLIDPEEVARRWGSRKNKPKMNYEKLSRGLRYYYDKNIIHKVPGKRYVYRFVCDLESMLGMSFTELQHQLKGEPSDGRPIRIERHPYPSQALLSQAANFGADLQSLSLNSANSIPSPLSSPYSVSPGISGSPVAHYGAYLPEFPN